MATELFLCVDCGGSKTSAVICSSSGTILGRALSGPSNFSYLGTDLFISSVRVAISSALNVALGGRECSLPPPPGHAQFSAAWFGISGIDSDASITLLTPVLSALLGIPPGPRLTIANDAHLLAAPIRLHPDPLIRHAIAVIAGTGSIVVSFRQTNSTIEQIARTGGWGWILSDEGGGFHVGREAVRQVLLAQDRASADPTVQRPSMLRDRILAAFGVHDALELLTAIHFPDPHGVPVPPGEDGAPEYTRHTREKRLSSLAPLVFAAAFRDRDGLALRVLEIASETLADQILLLVSADGSPTRPRPEETVLCLGGSLLTLTDREADVDTASPYRAMLLTALTKRDTVFHKVEVVEDAAGVGAMALARAFFNGTGSG